uniref:Uncharacterized protein n=1 Tax=Acrobeloides nanus TaxID=290746 RepID=A0A914DIU3_9BILA
MATQFIRFKSYGLHNVKHFGGGSMLEAPSVDRCFEKSLVKALNAIPQVIDQAEDDFPKRLKKCIEAGGGHFDNK